jgi:hypothetical protein
VPDLVFPCVGPGPGNDMRTLAKRHTCSQSVKTDRRIGVSADGFEPFNSSALKSFHTERKIDTSPRR